MPKWKGGRHPKTRTVEEISLGQLLSHRKYARWAKEYHVRHYYALEAQRKLHADKIDRALRSAKTVDVDIDNWSRVIPYRFTLSPLSAAGSIKLVGGRFNIGEDVSPDIPAFHALYIADNHETAMCEKYPPPNSPEAGLDQFDLSLANKDSITIINLSGHLHNLFDVNDSSCTEPLLKVIRKFRSPTNLDVLAKQARIEPWTIITTHDQMEYHCLEYNWRALPTILDIPSPSQILATLVRRAGLAGIKYNSTKSDGVNIAIFPENLSDTSFIEVSGGCPQEATICRLDSSTAELAITQAA